ncbi:hypothetical protein DdX_09131 [Ditylenchus destructor]|uniref:Uncharacterized protein n=1 Tax=Ditylenchus destructor TaxID=166010 RepID=A0AAD4R690_9BILA|nr:hypothetical protein DdX_09131 [Ditylenchus destructor]
MVTVNITRDGVLVLPVTFNVATAFQQYLAKSEPRLKGVVSMDHDKVKLTSKGTYHFQHVLKQRVFHNYLRDGKPAASPKHGPSGVTATAPSSEMNRMNLQGYNKRSTYANVTRYGKK